MSRVSFLTACIVTVVGIPAYPAENPEPLVSLLISKVTAEPVGPYTLIVCEATLHNTTGRDLTVGSNFFSAFDGLDLVATTPEGKVLEQRGYTEHQSLFSFKGRDFPVKQGKTVQELRFPLRSLPEGTRLLRVRLVGTLPSSGYTRILSSETLAVEVKAGTNGAPNTAPLRAAVNHDVAGSVPECLGCRTPRCTGPGRLFSSSRLTACPHRTLTLRPGR